MHVKLGSHLKDDEGVTQGGHVDTHLAASEHVLTQLGRHRVRLGRVGQGDVDQGVNLHGANTCS